MNQPNSENFDNIAEKTERLKGSNQGLDYFFKPTLGATDRLSKYPKIAKATAGLVGIGMAVASYISGNPQPLLTIVSAGIATGGVGGAMIQEIEERKQHRIARENRLDNLAMLGQNPNLDPILLQQLNYDAQTVSMLIRGDSINAVQQEAWRIDSFPYSLQKPAIEGHSEGTQALPSREQPEEDNTSDT